jgi:hypothetical protein
MCSLSQRRSAILSSTASISKRAAPQSQFEGRNLDVVMVALS